MNGLCVSTIGMVLALGVATSSRAQGWTKTNYYVNNRTGSDAFDGLAPAPVPGMPAGPLATITGALARACVGGRIVVANTGRDYRESLNINGYRKGRADNPLVIEGNGATVSGLLEVPAARWQRWTNDVWWFENRGPDGKPGPMPNSNWLGHYKHQGWFTEPQAPEIFFLNGRPATNVLSLAALPPAGFFYDTQSSPRRLYFRLPPGTTLDACRIEIPLNSGIHVSDDHVVIRNLRSVYSQDDGFSGFWGQGVVLENVDGSYNCDQGISFHGNSTTLIDGGLFERNGGCGIADVMSCVTVYRNCVIRNNMIEGAFLSGHAHALIGCRLYGNYALQVGVHGGDVSISLDNCLIVGHGTNAAGGVGVTMGHGQITHCTILDCGVGVAFNGGPGRIRNSVLADCGELLHVNPLAVSNLTVSASVLSLGQFRWGDARVTAATWHEATNANPRLRGNALEALALEPPLYRLPTNSPHFRFAEYQRTPGAYAITAPYEGWSPKP